MYAAAGGASLASRQARQRQQRLQKSQLKSKQIRQQQQQQQEQQQQQQQTIAIAASKASAPQSKQFHNLPSTYQNSAIKLSRVERNALRPPPQPAERRHSTSNHLKEPQRIRIKESPSILFPLPKDQPLTPTALVHQNHIPSMCHLPQALVPPEVDASQIHDPERRCSLVRQYEEAEKAAEKVDNCEQINHFYCFEGRHKGPLMYTELDRNVFGSMDYPFSECSQGRAAWQERERERRCSLSEAAYNHRIKQTEAHHRWMKRNRIHDTSYGGSSDEEDFFSVYYQSAAANALLYVGLGTTVIGLVIWFVGTGEKGFKTLELRLIGPTLIALGLLCCIIRVLLCICPSTCFRRRKKTRLKPNTCPHRAHRTEPIPDDYVMVDHNTSLLRKSTKKRVSIAPVPCTSASIPLSPPLPPHSVLTKLQQGSLIAAAATTFLQNERNPIPTIQIPSDLNVDDTNLIPGDSLIELQNLELYSLEVSSASSAEDSDSTAQNQIETELSRESTAVSKLNRSRQPKHGTISKSKNVGITETCLSVTTNTNSNLNTETTKVPHSGIVLSPSKLGQ